MSDAYGADVAGPDDRLVNYVFPVEVVVVGALTEEDHQTIEQRIWTRFSEALARSI
jgi:hypothetical protein